jgi:hypothetical protein
VSTAKIPPGKPGALVAVRVRSEGDMAAPCGFSIWTEKLYDGHEPGLITISAVFL